MLIALRLHTMRSPIALDLETHAFGPGNMAPTIVSAAIAASPAAADLMLREDAWPRIRELLDLAIHGSIAIVGAGIAYDFCCILAQGPADIRAKVWEAYVAGGISDVVIREKLLDIAAGSKSPGETYSLAALAKRHFGKVLDKGAEGWRLRYHELEHVPVVSWPTRAVAYAKDDATTTLDVWMRQADRARAMQYDMPTEPEEVRADLALKLITVWGIRTERARVEAVDRATKSKMQELAGLLRAHGIAKEQGKTGQLVMGGGEVDEGLRKDTRRISALVETTWPVALGDVPRTPTGKVSTSADTIEMCGHPALEALVEWTSLQKTGSTYVSKLWRGIDGPIHASYDAVLSSDRTSSFGEINIQNQPRLPGVRECFVPRAGTVFVSCDFDAQEMRTLAQACIDLVGRSVLADRFNASEDFDPHLELAAVQLLRIDVAEAKRRYAAKDTAVKEARQSGKIGNFGIPGGLGPDGMIRYAKGYGKIIDRKTAESWIASYRRQWPEMPKFFSKVREAVGDSGNGTIRIEQSGFVRGGCGYTDGCNTHFQTRAAHASKAALFEAARRCYSVRTSWLYGSRIVAFVHDELILEADERWAHEAAMELRDLMVEAMSRWTPGVRPSASPTLMARWSKSAVELWDGDRMVPWDDEIESSLADN